MAEGAPLIAVLPAKAYEEEHLPGAINIPLTETIGAIWSRVRAAGWEVCAVAPGKFLQEKQGD
jgi:hypothetical protein